MKSWHIALIAVAVIAAHGLLFWMISGASALPKANYIPPPNFVAKEAKFVDKATGEKMVYHEYHVSTKLALPDALMEKKDTE
jgi:hypothetical protein